MDQSDGSLEAQLYSPSRQQSPGNIFARLFRRFPRSQMLRDSDEDSEGHEDPQPHADSVAQDYYHYFADKNTFKKTLKHKSTGKDLVESLMRCVTYDQSTKTNELIGPHLLSAPESATVAEYLNYYLTQELREKSLRYLHVCTFLASWTPEAENAFSFLQRLRASFGDRLHALYNSPKFAIIDSVADIWELKPDVRQVLKGYRSPYPRCLSTQLPSANPLKTPPNILSTKGTSIVLEWQILPKTYKNDLDIYVWQYHLDPPPSISVTILVLPASSSQQRRVAILFNPRDIKVTADTPDEEQLLERFTKDALGGDRHCLVQQEWAAGHEVIRLILVFYGWMAQDTARFVDKIGTELHAMTRRGRERPSTSKIQYLMHLDDCCKKAVRDLTHSGKTLRSLVLAIDSPEFRCNQVEDKDKFLKMIHRKENDVKFLSNRVKGLAKPIDTVRNEIKEQMTLASGQRTLILTVLAALFIPLSFVSGIFGMNLSDPLFPSPSYITVPTTTTNSLGATITTSVRERVAPVTTVVVSTSTDRNGNNLTTLFTSTLYPSASVEAPVLVVTVLDVTLISSGSTAIETVTTIATVIPSATGLSTSSSNQHFWDAALYLEIALPLVVATIVLPLIIGSFIRFSMRTAFRHRLKWRALCAVGVAAYLGVSYGFLYWYPDHCGSDCPGFWYYNRSYTAFVLYLILVPGVLGGVAIAGLVQAFKHKRGQASWVFFAVLVLACVFAEVFVDYMTLPSYGQDAYDSQPGWQSYTPLRPVVLTWIPWMFLLAKWILGSRFQLSHNLKRRVIGLLGIRIRGRKPSPASIRRNRNDSSLSL